MIKVRKANLDDLELLLRFEQGIIEGERPYDPRIKKEPTNYYDLKAMLQNENIEIAIAEIDGVPAGSGYAKPLKGRDCFTFDYYAYLGFMYTEPQFRGRGVNKAVMDYLYDWCDSKGLYEVRLEVYPNNPSAIRAYEKAGMSTGLHMMRIDLREQKK